MAALTKKHHTEDVAKISLHGGCYAVPIEVTERYKITPDDQYTSIGDLFSDLTQKSLKFSIVGVRSRGQLLFLG